MDIGTLFSIIFLLWLASAVHTFLSLRAINRRIDNLGKLIGRVRAQQRSMFLTQVGKNEEIGSRSARKTVDIGSKDFR